MRRRALSAVATAGLAALVLSACTAGPTNPTDPSSDGSTAQSDPAPVVSVVNETIAGDEAADDGTSAQNTAAEAPAGTASASPADDAGSEASAPPSDAVTIEAGEELALTVDGGEFTEVTLVDADHDSVPADAGTFDADQNTADDAADDTAETDGSDDAAEAEGTDSTDEQAMAGGTTDPTHGLMEVGPSSSAATSESDESSETDGTSEQDSAGASGPEDSSDAAGDDSADPQGTEWESSTVLVTGATYTWEATTVAPDGAEHTATGTVTTPDTTAQEELTANTLIADDQTVGVGAPIVVSFNSTVPDEARAAIEARLSVEVTDVDGEPVDVEGAWGWLYDTADGISRVHYRPEEFWPADVSVDVSLPLEGVEYSPRWYGKEDVDLSFDVGRDQRVVADAQSHRMTIERDGEQIADWPTSLGSAQAPSYNGTHVVMAKHEFYTMTSERWDYETDVSWAVRIHNNGEFIHAAPWSVGVQGSANVSHGCINLSTERAKEYYDMALYGDPVEITGSSVDLSTEHSDISDWVYSWEDWQELSALD